MSTIGTVYAQVKHLLAQASLPEAEAEAQEILAHVCGLTYSGLRLRLLHACEANAEHAALEAAQRRVAGIPLAYVLGAKNFYGRDFLVDERVLIPRADTESVVECALKLAHGHHYKTALDLCCGSGCIGVTLACEGNFHQVLLSDASAPALEVARANIHRLDSKNICQTVQGDLFDALSFSVDLIVSNPPYVSDAEYAQLEPQIRDHEPADALLAGDGYDFYKRIAAQAGARLNPGGALVLEIGSTQEAAVKKLLNEHKFDKIDSARDLGGRPRVIWAFKKMG